MKVKEFEVVINCKGCEVDDKFYYDNFTDAVQMCYKFNREHFGHEEEFQQLNKITKERINWWE